MVASLCEAVDADVEQVARGMGMDERIGKRFLSAGIGYGGSCFPKDVAAFRYVAQQLGVDFCLLEEVERINELQKERFFQKIRSALWTLRKKRLGVLGLSFKGGTDELWNEPRRLGHRYLIEPWTLVLPALRDVWYYRVGGGRDEVRAFRASLSDDQSVAYSAGFHVGAEQSDALKPGA